MKVLSIIEPWATLIASKQKYIETRSWKTSYRGELYTCKQKAYKSQRHKNSRIIKTTTINRNELWQNNL